MKRIFTTLIVLNLFFSYDFAWAKTWVGTQMVYASWYGEDFNGKTMANGDVFDMYDSTIAAHKSLPFGTRVLLINVDTMQSIIVTITDRGPYIAGREFDVSYAAAHELGIVEEGVALLASTIIK